MAVDFGRWWKYAQAKLSSAVEAENRELDELEAERAAEVADKPWLAADGDAPTLEEAKARIEWEAEDQRRRTESASTPSAADPAPSTTAGSATPAAPATGVAAEPVDPDVAAARIELDRQAREGAARLDAIRKELGVDPPTGDGPAPKA